MKTSALSSSVCLIMAAMSCVHVALAQDAKPAAGGKDDVQETATKQQLTVMRTLAETIQVTVGEGDKSKQAKLIPDPIFRFSDQSRLHAHGSVWAWAINGRPVAMTEFRTYNRAEGVWGTDLVATSDVRLSADVARHGRWSPREPQFKLLPVPDTDLPARTEPARLRQMKQFARRLSASEVWQGQRSELRLLPTDVHRYSDPGNGLVDGGVFIFVLGSNPETILLIEAHKADSGELAWKFGLARMSAAAVTFLLDDREVWAVPESHGGPSSGYYSFHLTSPVPASAPRDN